MQPIHERMLVIIQNSQYQQWMDKSADENKTLQLLDNQAYTTNDSNTDKRFGEYSPSRRALFMLNLCLNFSTVV